MMRRKRRVAALNCRGLCRRRDLDEFEVIGPADLGVAQKGTVQTNRAGTERMAAAELVLDRQRSLEHVEELEIEVVTQPFAAAHPARDHRTAMLRAHQSATGRS